MDNNQRHEQDNYTYSVSPYNYGQSYAPYTPPAAPPPKKSRRLGGQIASIILAACIVSGGAGGAMGYLAAVITQQAALAGQQDTGGQDSDAPNSDAQDNNAQDNNAQDGSGQEVSSGDPSSQPSETSQNDIKTNSQSVNESDKALTPEEIYEKCNPAVVAIFVEGTVQSMFGKQTYTSAGSGFVVSEDGKIITNCHVVEGADKISVRFPNGDEYEASVVGADSIVDIAVLKIDANGLDTLAFGDSDAVKVGETVCVIGNPLGELANSQTVGTISGLSREITVEGTPMVMLQTDAAISPGNSGGPMINRYGEVIGIVTAKTMDSGVEGIGFAIPSNSALINIDDLSENGHISGRPYMGLSLDGSYSSYAKRYRLTEGAYIVSVEEGSCSEKAGLKADDIITGINNDAIKNESDLQTAKMKYKAGDTVTVKYVRDGKTYETQLTFDEMK